VVVGRKEAEEGTVTLRFRGEEKQETLPLAQALQRLRA
jgi:threonyl-tRNA synthetase